MTSLNEFRTKAAELYQPIPIETDSGECFSILPSIDLDEDVQKSRQLQGQKLAKWESLSSKEDVDPSEVPSSAEVKALFVELLAECSDQPEVAARVLAAEPMSTLMIILKEYNAREEAAKSAGVSE